MASFLDGKVIEQIERNNPARWLSSMRLRNLKTGASFAAHVALGEAARRLNWPVMGFCILAQGRTGSTLLADLLNSHPNLTCEGEILIQATRFAEPFVFGRAVRFSRKNRIWGFKAKHYQISACFPDQSAAFLKKLDDFGWPLIWLRRENMVKSALSTLIGLERGRWVYHKEEVSDFQPIAIDPNQFLSHLRGRVKQMQADRSIILDLPHFEIVYERDLERVGDQCQFPELMDFLQLPHQTLSTNVRKTESRPKKSLIKNWGEIYDLAISEGFKEMAEEYE